MRIIHVLSSVMWSGVERYALDICRHFLKSGCDVLAITRDARAVDDVFKRNGIPVTFAPLGGFLSYGAIKTMRDVFAASVDQTVVHCHSTSDAFAALLARRAISRQDIRIVLTRHYVRRPGYTPLHKYVYRNVDAIMCVSKIVKDRFMSGWRLQNRCPVAEERIHVLHNSLNIPMPDMTHEPSKGPITAMYLGRLSPGKGLENLINALSEIKDLKIRLRIVGTGHPDYVDKLRRLAQYKGVMNLIDWPRHKDNAVEFIRLSHFGVLPSSEPEAFGLSNIEYMSEGRPLICTNNGAQPEYITNGIDGILIPPSDEVSFAREMSRLANSQKLRTDIGLAARRKFESELSWTSFIARLEPIYFQTNS